MKELFCLLKLLVITDRLVRCLKGAVKVLLCVVSIPAVIICARLAHGTLKACKKRGR